MRLLLDTDALLWLLAGDPRLGAQARQEVEAAAELVVSAASLWEIAIKVSIGKLAALPWHHRDPFDRLLIAQAQAEALTVLTADPPSATTPSPLGTPAVDPTALPSAR